jgi:hypothetical protein
MLTVMFVSALWIWLGCILMCMSLAEEKGRSGFQWAIGGALFGILALIAIAGMPLQAQSDAIHAQRPQPSRAELERTARQKRGDAPIVIMVGLFIALGIASIVYAIAPS